MFSASGFFLFFFVLIFFFFKRKTSYEIRISGWSSDVCSSDLQDQVAERAGSGGYHAISSRRRSGAIIELVGIHGGVGGGEQRGAVAAIVGVECDADADADVAGLAAGPADR